MPEYRSIPEKLLSATYQATYHAPCRLLGSWQVQFHMFSEDVDKAADVKEIRTQTLEDGGCSHAAVILEKLQWVEVRVCTVGFAVIQLAVELQRCSKSL